MIHTKSIWTDIDRRKDGLRILVARFRGRGMPANRYDVWMPSLGPTETLLREFLAGRLSWKDYTQRYTAEIFEDPKLDSNNATIKNHGQKFTLRLLKHLARSQNITLLCHCDEDQQHCHRHLLQKIILSNKI